MPAGAVEERKALWRGQLRVTPPQMLPQRAGFSWLEALFPAGSSDQTGLVLRGTGASAGQATAPARVLGGPSDLRSDAPG